MKYKSIKFDKLPDPCTKQWLKAVEQALTVPGFSITPPPQMVDADMAVYCRACRDNRHLAPTKYLTENHKPFYYRYHILIGTK